MDVEAEPLRLPLLPFISVDGSTELTKVALKAETPVLVAPLVDVEAATLRQLPWKRRHPTEVSMGALMDSSSPLLCLVSSATWDVEQQQRRWRK